MNKVSRDEVCPECGRFANRGVSVDAVIVKEDTVLLIQRGVEPYKGFWGTPGGYVEWDESTEDAVRREVHEETGLTVTNVKMVNIYSDPARHPKQTINIVYKVEVEDGEPKANDDAEAVEWFSLESLPEQMAFDHKQNIHDALSKL
jgi:ADP-ribose pyrophosphatase YjhB (NUDIX family)